jgi:hypothetical protein
MSWPEVRAELVNIFKAIEISEPVPTQINRVYDFPPSASLETPCVIIVPPARLVSDRSNSVREVIYTVRCQVALVDADLPQALHIADSFAEAVLDAFDVAVALNSASSDDARLISQRLGEPGDIQSRDKAYWGFDCFLEIGEQQAKEFAP